MNSITAFLTDDRGADLLEYALLVGLVSLAAAAMLTNVGTSFSKMYERLKTEIDKLPQGAAAGGGAAQ